ncbi:MAG TPA: hypothetical protein VFV07_12055 [Rhizomicrobium sp.]|nr:hypothetical protein [Rhizomicrobium sp.]
MRNLSAIVFAACLISGPALAVDDSLYYTLYAPGDGEHSLTWYACTGASCFASGEIGPYKHACAVMDGKLKAKGNVETRAVYVLDKAKPSGTLHLIVYKRTDTFDIDDNDTVEVTQQADLDTGVVWQGLSKAGCLMAGNEQIMFAGLTGGGYVMVDKHLLSVTPQSGTLTFASADSNGYVTLGTADGAFQTYDNNGELTQSGSAARFTTDTRNAMVLP